MPSITSRFSTLESSDSNIGLNWSTLIRNGRLTTITTNTAAEMPIEETDSQVSVSDGAGEEGAGAEGPTRVCLFAYILIF